MRLWHYSLIRFLPKSQLLAQWRELNSIFKKQNKHILINYIYDHDKDYLKSYTWTVLDEMKRRNIKVRSLDNMIKYFGDNAFVGEVLFYPEHNDRYLYQCVLNLQEKYDRGQKDFTDDVYRNLCDFIYNYTDKLSNII